MSITSSTLTCPRTSMITSTASAVPVAPVSMVWPPRSSARMTHRWQGIFRRASKMPSKKCPVSLAAMLTPAHTPARASVVGGVSVPAIIVAIREDTTEAAVVAITAMETREVDITSKEGTTKEGDMVAMVVVVVVVVTKAAMEVPAMEEAITAIHRVLLTLTTATTLTITTRIREDTLLLTATTTITPAMAPMLLGSKKEKKL
mmetsp:Transcript_27458/g.50670  ORF Transcript_27458/g.50670 Transcript_27458/m.50670 type:complete len:203 (-) Transcript_27458:60-668(-)